jgi:Uma2 family endonuclease
MTAAVQPGFLNPIEYPETDGQPMAETDLHRDEMFDALGALKHRYRSDPMAYVAGNLLIYYEEGEPASRFAPDVFVVFGVPKRRRRVYKLWQEKRAPSFVLEVTSRGTRLEDKGNKRELCAELGVPEYFLYDPEADYLKPPLQGFHLLRGAYEPIFPDAKGMLRSETLGLGLTLEDGRLRFIDLATGAPLLHIEEQEARAEQAEQARQRAEQAEQDRQQAERAKQQAEQAKQQAEQAKQQAEQAKQQAEQGRQQAEQGRQQAEQRAATAEAEIARLRSLLERK